MMTVVMREQARFYSTRRSRLRMNRVEEFHCISMCLSAHGARHCGQYSVQCCRYAVPVGMNPGRREVWGRCSERSVFFRRKLCAKRTEAKKYAQRRIPTPNSPGGRPPRRRGSPRKKATGNIQQYRHKKKRNLNLQAPLHYAPPFHGDNIGTNNASCTSQSTFRCPESCTPIDAPG